MEQGLSEKNLITWLKKNGMGEVFKKYSIYGDKRTKFFEELRRVDLKRVELHRKLLFSQKTHSRMEVQPPFAPFLEGDEKEGWNSLKKGEWAEVILAGGAGTRFFSQLQRTEGLPEKAKGLFPITPVANRCFLDLFISEALYYSIKSGTVVPVLVMVSSITEDEIRRWIEEDTLYGFPKEYVLLFKQAEVPRLDEEGMFVVDSNGSLLWTGDGHGGLYRAIMEEEHHGIRILEWLRKEGVRNIVVHNVDNPLSRPLYPDRLGLHTKYRFLFTISCIKAKEKERVGLVAMKEGKVKVVEYSLNVSSVYSLTNLGHINVNLISLDAIRKDVPSVIYRDKPVKVGDKTIMTSTMETLVQSLVELLPSRRVGLILLEREKFFAPTKSVKGVDSVEEARGLLLNFWSDLMKSTGAEVHGKVEIHPSSGLSADELKNLGIGEGWVIGKDAEVYISGVHSPDEKPFSRGLLVEDSATLKLKVSMPYGKVEVEKRRLKASPEYAGKVRIGRDVKIKGKIEVKIEGAGRFEIPQGAVIRTHQKIVVREGESVVLRG